MTAYLLEMALLSPKLSVEAGDGAGPSRTAASAVYLARATVGVRDLEGCIWGDTMRYYTGYSADDLKDTVLLLHEHQKTPESSDLQCAHDHYSKKEQREVALKPALRKEDLGFPP